MRIFPSNSGVVVRMDFRAPHEPHAKGTVLAVGGGVPWVTPGASVLYVIGEATEQWVPREDYGHIWKRAGDSVPQPEQEMVHLIDQRAIHAVLAEPRGNTLEMAG